MSDTQWIGGHQYPLWVNPNAKRKTLKRIREREKQTDKTESGRRWRGTRPRSTLTRDKTEEIDIAPVSGASGSASAWGPRPPSSPPPPGVVEDCTIYQVPLPTTSRASVASKRKINVSVTLRTYGRLQPGASREFELDSFTDCEINRDAGDLQGVLVSDIDDTRTHACCGHNGRIALNLIMNPLSRAVMDDIQQTIYHWFLQLPQFNQFGGQVKYEYCHGCRCKRGKHRSVAMAEFAAASLRREGFEVKVEHLDLRPCGCPDGCKRVLGLGLQGGERKWVEDLKEDSRAAFGVAHRVWCILGSK